MFNFHFFNDSVRSTSINHSDFDNHFEDNSENLPEQSTSALWFGRCIKLLSFIVTCIYPLDLINELVQKFIFKTINLQTKSGASPTINFKDSVLDLSHEDTIKKSDNLEVSVEDDIFDPAEDDKEIEDAGNKFKYINPNEDADAQLAKMLQEQEFVGEGYGAAKHFAMSQYSALDDEAFARKLQAEFDLNSAERQKIVSSEKQKREAAESQKRQLEQDNSSVLDHELELAKAIEQDFYRKKAEREEAAKSKMKKAPVVSLPYAEMSLVDIERMLQTEEVTYQILNIPGLVAYEERENVNDVNSKVIRTTYDIGSEKLRAVTAISAREYPQAISLTALKAQREVNFEQYIALKIKRFSHVEEVSGTVSLPSGKLMKLEGLFTEFSVPMIMSSCETFFKMSKTTRSKDNEWIISQFNASVFSEYLKKKGIGEIVEKLQDPDFIGPLIMQTGYSGHCAAVVWAGNYLLYIDRNGRSATPGINVFYLSNPELITEDFIDGLVRREDVKVKVEDFRIVENIFTQLNGTGIYCEEMLTQPVGNCAHATMDAVLYSLIVIRELLNAHGDKLKNLTKASWATAFTKARPQYQKWSDYEHQIVFDDMISEIEEWLTHKTSISKINLKKTYEELLTCWISTKGVKRNPIAIQKVQGILAKLAIEGDKVTVLT